MNRLQRLHIGCLTACVAVLVWTTSAVADVTVSAEVNRNRCYVGDQVRLTVTVQSDEGQVDVELPPFDMENAQVIGPQGPSTSQQFSIVNGSISRSYTARYTFGVTPLSEGRMTIPALDVTVDGNPYQTRAVNLQVRSRGGGSSSQSGGKPDKPGQQQSGQTRDEADESPLWMRADLSRTTVYQGQQTVVSYILYENARTRIGNRQISAEPNIQGFWTETLFDARREEPEHGERVINGIRYNVMPILRQVLFPTTSGTFDIPTMSISAVIEEPTNRVDFFGRRYYQRRDTRVSSRPRQIEVRPLPTGAPASFNGAVGSYRITGTVDRTEVTQGDPITWRLTIRGTGNINALPAINLPPMQDFRLYDPTEETDTGFTSGSFGGTRTWERVVIPIHSGILEIPSISFTFFDPEAEEYRTVSTERVTITVHPGAQQQPGTAVLPLTQSQIRQVGSDIRFIQPDATVLQDETELLWYAKWYWVLVSLPVLLLAGSAGVRIRRERLSGDVGRLRAMGASSEARKLLKKAREHRTRGDAVAMTEALSTAISELVAGHGGVTAAGLTSDQVRSTLEEKDVEEPLVENTLDILKRCDRVRFAPSSLTNEEAEDLYASSHEVVDGLFRYLKR